MGQTQSQKQQQQQQPDLSHIYASYIQKQQDMIYQQQSQINSLYQHNLSHQMNQQQMPPNMFFQNDINQRGQQGQQGQQGQRPSPQLQAPPQPRLPPAPTMPSHKLDPYQLLNLPKEYDETMLKKAYLKKAMKTHPDRGGSAQEFQKVSIAYTLLTKKLKGRESLKTHQDLRQGAKDFLQTQESQPKRNINMKDNFDSDLFNKIYEDNKIKDVYDAGYGSWMQQNPALESENTKMFQNGFNKDMFNATFDQYKQEQQRENGQQMVRYTEPQQRLSMKNQDSLVTLGQQKISDFSGTTDNLHYTDYKQAYTHGSTLIDVNSVSIGERANSIGGIKSQRSNLSYQMTPEDSQKQAMQHRRDQQQEEKRVRRLQVYDQQHGQAYEKIHRLLLR
jgi:curved DNA-binding protein CbpA